jgi:hypothetical protein
MTLVPRPHPPALAHGEITRVLPGLHMVSGTVSMPGPLPVRFSRNMTVIEDEGRLVLVNSMRLDEAGLRALDALGRVTDVIRIGANHGMDDPFYRERYGARVWAVKGQRYTSGFDTKSENVYFEPDEEIDETTPLPIAGARVYVIASAPPEGLLLLRREGGVCIAADCLQHWHDVDDHFNWLGGALMRMFGFIKPFNVGPGWLRQGKPPKTDLRGILDLPFTHVLPAHGSAVVGSAPEKYRAALERAALG